ncbi:MAG: putative esterase [Acidobacteria bacterium]|nr:putative esterase [Acidobacteriota bacterium]
MSAIHSLQAIMFALLFNIAASAQELTLDEILKKNEDALGGAEALRNIKTLQLSYKAGASQNTLYLKLPDCMRSELLIQGRQLINARSGKSGWSFNPLQNPMLQTQERKPVAGGIESEIASQIYWLSGIQAAGGAVELLGKETVKGSPAYKLKVTPVNSQSMTCYLDTTTFLPLKIYIRMESGQRVMERERYLGDFKKVDGITFAHSAENKITGEFAGTSREDYEKIAVNQPIDDSMFRVPAPEMLAEMTRGMSLNGRLEKITVHGESLAGNLVGDSPDRPVTVYLPPGYDKEPNRRYPVVYFLHGFGGTNDTYTMPVLPGNVTVPAEKAFAAGAREMILVVPNGMTIFQGCMYSSSVTTGDWETFIAKELVTYIDGHYRTIPERASRGLAGHSMGGYGTFRIGMKHPEVFSSMYSMSPCCMPPTMNPQAPLMALIAAIKDKKEIGRADFPVQAMMASAAAWSPNPKRPPFYLDLPVENGKPQPETIAKWAANAPVTMVHQYIPNLKRYKAIAFDIGDKDVVVAEGEDVMLKASKDMDRILRDYGIAHIFEIYEGDHTNRIPERVEKKVIPFFSQNLAFPAEK